MCGFDLGCQIHRVIDPVWFYIFWGFWGIVGLLILGALVKIKQIAGWPGVAGVGAALIYALGYFRGRSGGCINPLEQVDEASPDARPAPSKPKRKPVSRPAGKRRYNADTNSWE